jgi:hypothetical protein
MGRGEALTCPRKLKMTLDVQSRNVTQVAGAAGVSRLLACL